MAIGYILSHITEVLHLAWQRQIRVIAFPVWQQSSEFHSPSSLFAGRHEVDGLLVLPQHGSVRFFDSYFRSSRNPLESLIDHPMSMTPASMDPKLRQEAGITVDLIRLSVELESIEDILDDFSRALDTIAK